MTFGAATDGQSNNLFVCPAEAPVVGAPASWAHTRANTWNYAEDSAVRTHFRQHSTLTTVFPVSEGPCLFKRV